MDTFVKSIGWKIFAFTGLWALLSGSWVYAAPQYDLYQVVLPQEVMTEQAPSLDLQLRQGMAKFLIRLTGNPDVVYQPAYQTFLKRPKKWLKQYFYRPRLEEGVQVGQDLVLKFDRQRILQQFQKKGLIIWPYELRPKLLVVAKYEVAGIQVLLNASGLTQHLNLDFRPVAEELGLPIQLPNQRLGQVTDLVNLMQQTPENLPDALSSLRPLLVNDSVSGVLLLHLKRIPFQEKEGYRLTYFLYDQKTFNQVMTPKTLEGSQLKKLYQSLFSEMAAYFSAPYRMQAGILGEVLLTVVPSVDEAMPQALMPEQVFQLEKWLQNLKPTLHEAKLIGLNAQHMQFELTYQGSFNRLLSILKQGQRLDLISSDALTGELKMQLRRPTKAFNSGMRLR